VLRADDMHPESAPQSFTATRRLTGWQSGYPATLKELSAGLRAREFSCIELTSQILDAAAASQASINAFISITTEIALRQADRVDRMLSAGQDLGPLMGVPLAIKDVFDVAGVATTAGSRLFEANIAVESADAVSRLTRCGAVVIGKANMDQFAIGPHQEDFGRTNCPASLDRYAGGSSCGTAAAVAAHLSLAALGTDAGGSTRFPAACCGVVGVKPTFGLVPTRGVFPTLPSLDHVALVAGTVDEVRQVLRILAGLVSQPVKALDRAPHIGVLADWETGCEDRVRTAMSTALASLAERGARVSHNKTVDGFDGSAQALATIAAPEALAELEGHLPAGGAELPAGLRELLEAARSESAHEYLNAQEERSRLRASLNDVLVDVDVLAMPTMGSEAWRWSDIDAFGRAFNVEATRFLPLANLTGHPSLSLPIPSEGLPVGLQLIAKHGDDEFLIDVARWVEQQLAA
jgi:aspartyl-tRNA(Asn)/glutamyl-tRNA(Gln) amidotransferase subunit A